MLSKRNVYNALGIVIITLFMGYYTLIAKNCDLSFDGAIYSQGIVSLLEYGTYLNYTYGVEDISKSHFPLFTQGMLSQYFINIPFVAFWGKTNFIFQINNLIFLFLSSILTYYLIILLTERHYLGIISIVLFFTFPGLTYLGLGGFGEVAAFFYITLTSLILYKSIGDRRFMPLLGLSLFLTVHTKLFLILLFPILLCILLYLWLFEKKLLLKDIVVFMIAFILPILMLHFIILFKYGWDELVNEYGIFLTFVGTEQSRVGVGLFERFSIGSKAINQEYGSFYNFYIPLSFGYIASIIAIFRNLGWSDDARFGYALNLDRAQTAILFLFSASSIYIIYYFHLSSSFQGYRRILPILLINIPLYAICVSYLWKTVTLKSLKLFTLVISFLIFAPFLFHQVNLYYRTFQLITKEDQTVIDRKEIVEILNKIPQEERIFGVGWWQAPRLSLYTGRFFYDILRNRIYDKGYLVFDNEALQLAPDTVRETLEQHDVEVVKKNSNYQLYKWKFKKGLNNDDPLILMQIGPNRTKTSVGFNLFRGKSGMWATTKNETKSTVIMWNGTELETVLNHPTNLTAAVPSSLYSKPGRNEIYLFDYITRARSNSLFFEVEN